MMINGHVSELLPAYVNGTLAETDERYVRNHLSRCVVCEKELASWRAVSEASISASKSAPEPSGWIVERALAEIERQESMYPSGHPSLASHLSLAWQLLRGQMPLVRREIWIASPLTMAVGFLLALMTLNSGGAGLTLALFAPIVAALGVAFIYGPENDPSLEITLSTPTSPRLVLLARLTLVYGYDLALALAATVVLAVVQGAVDVWPLISLWIGPMLFLSALTMLLSLLAGTTVAVFTAMVLWVMRLLAATDVEFVGMPMLAGASQLIDDFWRANLFLLPLAFLLLAAAALYVPRLERLARV